MPLSMTPDNSVSLTSECGLRCYGQWNAEMEIHCVADFALCPPPITVTGQSPAVEVQIHFPLLRVSVRSWLRSSTKNFSSVGGEPNKPKPHNFLKFQPLQLEGDDMLEMRLIACVKGMHWLLTSFWLPKETEMQILISFFKFHNNISKILGT